MATICSLNCHNLRPVLSSVASLKSHSSREQLLNKSIDKRTLNQIAVLTRSITWLTCSTFRSRSWALHPEHSREWFEPPIGSQYWTRRLCSCRSLQSLLASAGIDQWWQFPGVPHMPWCWVSCGSGVWPVVGWRECWPTCSDSKHQLESTSAHRWCHRSRSVLSSRALTIL